MVFCLKASQSLKIHHIQIKETDESEVVLHHKSFSNNICVDLICLSFANVVLSHLTGFDGVQHTYLVKLSNKVSNKVVTVVCRRLKNDAAAVLVEGIELRDQQLEAISVVCEFERLKNYFTVGRNRSGEMVEFGNINAYKNFHEVVPPFHKV